MFLRRNRRKVNGESYEYWTLVQSVRTASGPRQQVVACLGKLPGLDSKAQAGWEDIDRLLEGTPETEQLYLDPTETVPKPQWREVDVQGLRVERVRDFGEVYLALALWRRLGLQTLLERIVEPGKEEVNWETVACLLVTARFCAQKSELGIAERWYQQTALEDLLGVSVEKINDDRLYRGLDVLREKKQQLTEHLLDRYQSWFGVDFEFLIYDVTSTFFEGQALGNEQAARGYSRDSRPDCKQVCIGLVVSAEGLPLAYEVFSGNRNDVTTVEEIVETMESKYGQAQRIWVMDRGMVSEENIEYLRNKKARYIVGTRKAELKTFEKQLLDREGWAQVRSDVEVKLVEHPDRQGSERYILCRSQSRVEKEKAMLARQENRLLEKLLEIDRSLARKAQNKMAVERRVGRWLGRYPAAERLLEIQVLEDDAGLASGLSIASRIDRTQWALRAQGAYLLRTNCLENDPAKVWEWYLQLQQAEAAFRTSKSDLCLRPVFHQKTERVEAHILVCFLSLALWRVLEMWMKGKGLGSCARQLLQEIGTIKSMDVILPVRTEQGTTELRLRVISKPERRVAELLHRLELHLPQRNKIIENVVEKIAL